MKDAILFLTIFTFVGGLYTYSIVGPRISLSAKSPASTVGAVAESVPRATAQTPSTTLSTTKEITPENLYTNEGVFFRAGTPISRAELITRIQNSFSDKVVVVPATDTTGTIQVDFRARGQVNVPYQTDTTH